MTENTEPQDADEPVARLKARLKPDDPRFLVERRCQQVGINLRWGIDALSDDRLFIHVEMPNGPTKRPLVLDYDGASRFLNTDFENVKFLGDYDAVQFTNSQSLEALLRAGGPVPLRLHTLPGAQRIADEERPTLFDAFGMAEFESPRPTRIELGDKWCVTFRSNPGDHWHVEVGSASTGLLSILGRSYLRAGQSIRINGINAPRHEGALRVLERVANAVLFECEVKYGIVAILAHARRRRYVKLRGKPPSEPPLAPRFQYQKDAFSLYSYACSAQGMPLLQYLAYYQVLEYYFPSYARREVLDRLRNQIKDPDFQLEEDAHLGRLIDIMRRYGAGYGNEQEQLKATVRACVEEDQVKSLLVEENFEEYFTQVSRIKGLSRLNLKDRREDMRDQVSRRIYDLRCRIVHTKDEATDRVPELLLPFSAEANSIGPDIELLKYIAQRALIANAVPMRL
jgi:hypothetical protein